MLLEWSQETAKGKARGSLEASQKQHVFPKVLYPTLQGYS